MGSVKVLNQGVVIVKENDAENTDISSKLQKMMLQVKGDFMTEEGKDVDYNGLKKSGLFGRYTEECKTLQNVEIGALEHEQKMAFFINTYNALTIHGVCEEGVPMSVLEVKQFWRTTAYNIGGNVYTLDDIEHGILRGNRPHPSSPKPLFGESDPRFQYSLLKVDPRIHFAVVCGAKSCPAINVYSSKNLERGLEAATQNFCSQEVHVDLEGKKVKMSKLFLWYKVDFGETDEDILSWILPYLSGQVFLNLEKLLNDCQKTNNFDISITYTDYNWNLNSIQTADIK